MKVVFLLAGIGCLFAACLVPVGALAVALFFICGLCLFLAFLWKKPGSTKETESAFSITHFNNDTFTLTVTKRSPALTQVLQIKDAQNYTVKYKPEELHVGAVTVGGITTGGAYTTGGYHYVSNAQNNGLCNLYYLNEPISRIQLPPSLYEQAKSSDIAPYLNDKMQIEVIADVPISQQETQAAINSMKATGFAGNSFINKGRPTKKKCLQIVGWLTTP